MSDAVSEQSINATFERGFLSKSLEQQIRECDDYELVPYFRKWLPEHQPILEAGCGSGRWVAWFKRHGWEATGLDWSEALCARAREAIPDAEFFSGDMRDMPFADGAFGSIVSLGAVEHATEGPIASLREYARVLRPGGVAIITVPFLGPVRRALRVVKGPWRQLKHTPLVRRLLRKPVHRGRSLREVKRETVPRWAAEFLYGDDGWSFFQYHFSKRQMRQFLAQTGFEVVEEFVAFGDQGIVSNFGFGRYDSDKAHVVFSPVGNLLRRVLPVNTMGHMLGYVVRRR